MKNEITIHKDCPYKKSFLRNQKEELFKIKMRILNDKSDGLTLISKTNQNQSNENCELAQNYTLQDIAIGVKEQQLKKLREIELAFEKFSLGTYGICEESGAYINMTRLQKIPWARYSIEIAEQIEREHLTSLAA